MLESQDCRDKAQKLQELGLPEAESGEECSCRVSEIGETQGLGLRLQQGGLGWWSLHSLRWGLDLRGPRAWKPARERSRAVTRLSGEWGRPLPTPYGQQVSCLLTLSFHRQEEETGASQDSGERP